MKRVSNLMPRIADMDNLREAFLRAASGKTRSQEVLRFREGLEENLYSIRESLLGPYRLFTIFDPKRRTICAAPFADRVAFHAMMRVCHPLFENYQISVSYASRIGLGTYKALEQARHYSHRYQWFLKMDVVKFFDSIDHRQMKHQLSHLVKDSLLLAHWDTLIDGYETAPGKGLPIGNLTSQYFANHYMAVADHFAKEKLGVGPMVRYMDDVVLWGNDKQALLRQAKAYRQFLSDDLHLELHPFTVNRTHLGMSFLGYVVNPQEMRINQRSRHRYRQRVGTVCQCVENGSLSQQQGLQRLQAMIAFLEKANSRRFMKCISEGL